MALLAPTVALLAGAANSQAALAEATIRVGFATADLTPALGPKPVWIAGYGNNRRATGVHDPIMARTCVLADAEGKKIAIVSVDLVGLQYRGTLAIRDRLKDYSYVLVSSTHNHEGPDVIGLWGPSRQETGIDSDYLKLVVDRVVKSVKDAESALAPASAQYGAATDDSLVHDARLPIVKEGTLRLLRFETPDGQKPLGILVQWNCHPEHLGSKNTLLTADYPYYLVKELAAKHGVPIVYLTGSVGGLMTGDEKRFPKPGGGFYGEGEFEFAEAQGKALCQLTDQALASASPIRLTPFVIAPMRVAIPLANEGYRRARAAGVLVRDAYRWTGDPNQPGELLDPQETEGELALVTEVAYLNLGELHVAAIPGETYPELVLGKYQHPADPGADFPDAPLEPPILKSLPGNKVLIIGLANDEVGYIIPKRQWDQKPPFAYEREKPQYGEVNSCGPEVAPILTQALADAVKSVVQSTKP